MGVQSAIVVGPEGEEIYTDDYGRVKVQFYWDREGQSDEHSSCWIRVSQAWAGGGFGMSQIPRVGHEVLVGFFDGDPDRPVVIGRLHNRGNPTPEALPQHKTKTVWRSCSTPAADGYNEISFEDAAGDELLRLRAQRNLEKIVLADENASVGANLVTTVKSNETRAVGGNQSLAVRGDRVVDVSKTLTTRADAGLQVQAGLKTGVHAQEGKLVISNGSASIVLDGPHIQLNAAANLRLSCGRLLALSGKQVDIDGDPEVFINSGEPTPPAVELLPIATHSGEAQLDHEPAAPADRNRASREGGVERPGGLDEAELEIRKRYEQLKKGLLAASKLGVNIQLPPEVDEQLQRLARISYKAGVVRTKLLDPETYQAMQERLERRLLAEKKRLQKLGADLYEIFEGQRDHVTDLAKRLETRFEAEKENVANLKEELGAIFSGERGNLLESGKALVETVREQAAHVMALRRDLLAMLEREKAYVKRFIRQWKGAVDKVKEYIGGFKDLIENPKDALLDIIFGQDKELAKDLVSLAEEFGYGDKLAELLGLDDPGVAAEEVSKWTSQLSRPSRVGLMHGGIDLTKHTKISRASRVGGGAGGIDLSKYTKASEASLHGTSSGGLDMSAHTEVSETSLKGASSGAQQGGDGKLSAASMKGAQHGGYPMTIKYAGSADGFDGAGGVSELSKAGIAAGGHSGAAAGPTALSRSGGMAATDVASALEGGDLAFMQTPAEGQLMVLPSPGAQALDQSALTNAMVDAQMAGTPVGDAVAMSLQESGYTVYRREWGDWTGPFVQAAKQTASA